MKYFLSLALACLLLTGCNIEDIKDAYDDLTNTEDTVPTTQPPAIKVRVEERGVFSGYGNPAPLDRALFRFHHPGSFYGPEVEVWFDGKKPEIVNNGAIRQDLLYAGLWKPVGNDGNLAIHGGSGFQIKECVIKYFAR